MFRALLATLLLVPSPAVPQTIEPNPLVLITCPMPGGYSAGTGVRIGSIIVSADHVTHGDCYANGKHLKSFTAPGLDFSISPDVRGAYLKVDCDGFVRGRKYIARGYARGLHTVTEIELTGTGEKSWGFSILTGVFTVIPGMSGGAITDAETGKLVGIINIYDMPRGLSGSVAMADTPICKGKA